MPDLLGVTRRLQNEAPDFLSAIYFDPAWPLFELMANLQNEKRSLKAMSVPAVNLFGPTDWYRTIRDQIQHEDNLIVQRLSWLMAAQSFFFTGYAIIANASPQARNPLLAKQQDLLFSQAVMHQS